MVGQDGSAVAHVAVCPVWVVLLDIVPGRNADDVGYWLSRGSWAWRRRIYSVAVDPRRGHLSGITACLPDTTVTVDCFHGVTVRHERRCPPDVSNTRAVTTGATRTTHCTRAGAS